MQTHTDSKTPALQLIATLAAEGNWQVAEIRAGAISDDMTSAEAWHLLARVHSNAQRWDRALLAVDAALRSRPDFRPLRFERAILLDQLGSSVEALAEFEALAREAEDSPLLLAHLARALRFAGRLTEAEATLESGIRRWPTDVQQHSLLARLRWQCGHGEQCTLWLERAIARYPRELQLRLVAADVLRNAGFLDKALALLQAGLKMAPGSAGFLTSIGVVLDGLQRPTEALSYLRAAVSRAPSSATFKRNLIPALLRVSEPAEALALCDELLERAPDDQQLIAYSATALRISGDPRYGALHDYDRLVRLYRPSPPGFADIDTFNAAFANELLQLHAHDRRPLEQSLRGGTQTDRNLPESNPVIAAFFAMIDAPIKDYISRLQYGSDHPTDRRKTAAYRIAGSWSVRLHSGGFHISHVHPLGWLSSAYYVDVPNDIADEAARPGWLKFGEPGAPTPGCPADHFVKPEAGMLVLFPSYMWHGTVPFREGTCRLTAAFDVVPA